MTTVIIQKKAIKHVYLRLQKDGRICVSAPLTMPDEQIHALIQEKRCWIEKKQHLQRTRQALAQSHLIPPANTLLLFGNHYPIVTTVAKRQLIKIVGHRCEWSVAEHTSETQRQKYLVEFYREQLMSIVQSYIAHYQPIIGVEPNEIRTKQMKTRWGTCNYRDKRLWFNVQLAKLAQPCIAYVVVHEMTHLLERYHNRRFYALVAKAMPNWRYYHDYLKGICLE